MEDIMDNLTEEEKRSVIKKMAISIGLLVVTLIIGIILLVTR